MLVKPKKYDEVQINEDYTPIELGGHKGIIVGISEYTSPVSGNTSLKVVVDTDKDDRQPNYFTEQYKNDKREDKKYSNSAIKYVSLKEDDNCIKMLKGFITAVENSNPGYTFDWNKEVDQLKGKKVGIVFGLEEYEDNEGKLKTIAKLNQFRSLDKVLEVKIPKVKKLDNTFIEYEQYKNSTNKIANEVFDGNVTTDDDVPFEI